MRRGVLALVAAWACAAPAAAAQESRVNDRTEDFIGLIRYQAPPGWDVDSDTTAPDAYARFRLGEDVIAIRAFGGPGSAYADQAAFLESPSARTLGKTPRRAGQAKVGTAKLPLFRRGYPIRMGDPRRRGAPAGPLADEVFCVLPAGERFLVLSYARENPAPDPKSGGRKAWEAFLRALRPGRR